LYSQIIKSLVKTGIIFKLYKQKPVKIKESIIMKQRLTVSHKSGKIILGGLFIVLIVISLI